MSIPIGQPRRNWRPVSAESPCPICSHANWCSISADGAIVKCQRVAEGPYRTANDKNGQEYHLHRLDGTATAPTTPPPIVPAGTAAERADADTLHAIYYSLLGCLSLTAAHRDNLRGRGLTDEQINCGEYRTLPVGGRAALASKLREQFSNKLLSVPGFYFTQRDSGPYVTLAGAAGLVVPVRDLAGRIVALKVRRDDCGDGPRYSYLSSKKHGGPGPCSPVHVPLGVAGPCLCVRVTEGELKADVATAQTGLPTISVPGAGNCQLVSSVVRELAAKTVRLAFDVDARDNPQVARSLSTLADALAVQGVAVQLERWPAEHKGIDDALANSAAVELLTGDAARQAITDTLAEATAGEPISDPGPLGRLNAVLADGDAEGLYRDGEMLRALARFGVEPGQRSGTFPPSALAMDVCP